MNAILLSSHLLVDLKTEEILQSTGIHIGLDYCTKEMKRYVSRKEQNYNIFNINTILNRIDVAGKLMAAVDPSSVLVYGAQRNHFNAVKMFSRITKVNGLTDNLVAGSLTNSNLPSFVDADLLLVSDAQNKKPLKFKQASRYDARAVEEASNIGIPIIGICNTDAVPSFIDLVIPANNKGSKAIATVFYLLTRSYLMARGELAPDEALKIEISAFETMLPKYENI